jgi:prepilin-type N-terminal cleavage/methylation domain-containing protein
LTEGCLATAVATAIGRAALGRYEATSAMAQPNTNPGARTGFSLIELTLVVFLLGISAAIAIPRYANSLCSYRAAMAAKRVAADLALARNDAWMTGSRRTVSFSQTNNQYQLTGIADPDHPGVANCVVNLSNNPYRATLGATTFQGQTVTFDSYGMPSAGGQITVTAGTAQRTVYLDAANGRVTAP